MANSIIAGIMGVGAIAVIIYYLIITIILYDITI
jgi:hypothetical protein